MPGSFRYFAFEKRDADNAWLDFLRSLAIILVFVRHGRRAYPAATDGELGALDFLALNGWVGVDLFLVLSGFLIASNLIRARRSSLKRPLTVYFAQRALRILPAYYVVLLLVIAGAFPLFGFSHDGLFSRTLYHILFLQDYLPSDINVVFWSLGVEEKFYIAAPLIVGFLMARRRPLALFFSLVALLSISPVLRSLIYAMQSAPALSYLEFWQMLRSPFHAVLEPLVIGVGVAVAASAGKIKLEVWQAKFLLFSVLSIMALWLSTHQMMASITWFDVAMQPLLIALLFGAAVFSAVYLGNDAPPGEMFFRVMARLSYVIYLVHYPLTPLSRHMADISGGSISVFWLYYIGLTLMVAAMLHYVVEKPFLILRRNIFRQAPHMPGSALARA